MAIKKSTKCLLIMFGILTGFILTNEVSSQIYGSNLMDSFFGNEQKISDGNGRFYCWWIDDVMNTEEFKGFTDFQKDLFVFNKKWCLDEPRPTNKGGILMINN